MANHKMSEEKNGMLSKVIKHGDTLIILGAIASMFLYFDGKFEKSNDRFIELQKQFNTTIEQIGKVDGDARVRDKELELMIAKSES